MTLRITRNTWASLVPALLLMTAAPAALAGQMSRNTGGGACPAVAPGSTSNCPQMIITARAGFGPLTLGTPFISNPNPTDFSVAATTCTDGLVLPDGGSCTINMVFHPTTSGYHKMEEVLTSNATQSPVQGIKYWGVTNDGFYAEQSEITCPNTEVGQMATCDFTLTVRASTAYEIVGSGSVTPNDFVNLGGTCDPGYKLGGTRSCFLQFRFVPKAEGLRTGIITVKSTAPNSPLQIPIRGFGGTESIPTEWRTTSSGVCAGGTGSWQLGDWAPSTGCGLIEQTRTVSCLTEALSGTMAQTVTCVQTNGAPADESDCDPETRPADTIACTPTSEVCGASPDTQQTTTLTTDCPSGDEGDGEEETPTSVTKKGLCTPDPANQKFCLWMPL